MRFALETHGCRLNQAESDAIVEQLRARGHELAPVEEAELYVLNSCAITHGADADARAAIRRARRKSPNARVVITGCHANASPEALASMPELDAVIGNAEKRSPALWPLLEEPRVRPEPGQGGALVAVERLTRRVRPEPWVDPPATQPRRTRPLLKVQDGCDYQCSFCIVPSVRGRSRSASIEQVSEQLSSLLEAEPSPPEVVLTGAHLGTWGRDLGLRATPEGAGLARLVRALLEDHPGARLRLGSVDPHEVDAGLVELLAAGVDPETGAGLCQHIHLPVQSGDDGVLRAMRRAHTVEDLVGLVARLRERAPAIGLGTDVIVGFPGETEAAFERTLALFETLAIPFAHVFTWSPRRGTPAFELAGRVDPSQASARSRRLRACVERASRAFVEAQIGTTRSAVVLRRRTAGGSLRALTDNYLDVELEGPDALLGRRAHLRVDLDIEGRARGVLVE